MEYGTKFRYVFRSVEKEALKKFASKLSPLNITPNQAEVLLVLADNEPLSLKEIGDLLICEQKSPSRLVQGLVEKGFIYKGKQATDGRYSVLYLTKEGKALVPKLQKIENCFDEELSQFLKNNIDVNEMMSCFQEYLKGTRSEKKLKLRSLWD
ncbi:MarR family transcriptional regulator [bacterium 1xD8-6]|nr:MarR family transcriptional regulator [bacterium D16-36]RKI70405.1 MarR family transcriptional regulator [bacterium 1xD8-6]